jgi:hypothetical protein
MGGIYEKERVRADFARHTFYVVRGRPGQNDRPALPAGHPVTWGAITEGTVLERSAYPFPVFIT